MSLSNIRFKSTSSSPIQTKVVLSSDPKKVSLVFTNYVQQELLTLDLNLKSSQVKVISCSIPEEDRISVFPSVISSVTEAFNRLLNAESSRASASNAVLAISQEIKNLRVFLVSIFIWTTRGGDSNAVFEFLGKRLPVIRWVLHLEHKFLLKFLIENGLNLNEPSALNPLVLTLLLPNGEWQQQCFSLLLEAGADPFQIKEDLQSSPFAFVLRQNNWPLIKILLNYINLDDPRLPSKLEQSGFNPNQAFPNRLLCSFSMLLAEELTKKEKLKLCQLLLMHKADPFLVDPLMKKSFFEFIVVYDKYASLFQLVVESIDLDNSNCRELFESAGMDPNICRHGYSTLRHILADKVLPKHVRQKVLRLYIRAGADIFFKTENSSDSPIHVALKMGDTEAVALFIKEGMSASQLKSFAFKGDIKKQSEELLFRKMCAHRFGLPLEFEITEGVREKYEGFSTRLSCRQDKSALFPETELIRSVRAFFRKHPDLSDKKVLQNIAKLEQSEEELTQERAQKLAADFQQGKTVVIEGNWPNHHVTLAAKGSLLFVINRGGQREEGYPPGIQIYTLVDKAKFTAEALQKLASDSLYITDPKKRVEIGLSEEIPRFYRLSEQSGGLCSWQNRKTALIVLFALAWYDGSLDATSMLLQMADLLDRGKTLYKKWSRGDRSLAIDAIVARYTSYKHPDLALLLYLLVRLPSGEQQAKIYKLLKTYQIQSNDFIRLTSKGRNILSYCKSTKSLHLLKTLAGEDWEHISKKLNQPGKRDPLIDLCEKGRWDLVEALIERSNTRKCDEADSIPLIFLMVDSNRPDLIEKAAKSGMEISLRLHHVLSILDYAFASSSRPQKLILHLIENYSDVLLSNEGDKEISFHTSLEVQNWDAAWALWERGARCANDLLIDMDLRNLLVCHEVKNDVPARLLEAIASNYKISFGPLVNVAISQTDLLRAELLLKCGADRDKALHRALRQSNPTMVSFFLRRGANPYSKNKKGLSAIAVAEKKGLEDLLKPFVLD